MIRQKPRPFDNQHREALAVGSELTRWYRKDWDSNVLNVTPELVIEVLSSAGVRFVLMGAHGINGYRGRARSTDDVDVLVVKRDVRKAVRLLAEEFPYLAIKENAVVVRFLNEATQKVAIDVRKPTSEAMRIVFRNSVAIGKTHRIPDLEMAVISKWIAMTSETRRAKRRQQDAVDLAEIIENNRNELQLHKLFRLAKRLRYRGPEHLQRIIDDVDNDRPIKVV